MSYTKQFTAHPELLQVQALIPFAPWVTASRAAMFASEIGQACVLLGADPRMIQSGMEREFGRGTDMRKMPCNAMVVRVIQHYPPNGLLNPNTPIPTSVIYQDMDTEIPEYGLIHIPPAAINHYAYGFDFKRTSAGQTISKDQSLPKGTILARSPSLKDNGEYCYGINAKIALMSIPEVGQDAVVMSESFAKRCQFKGYGDITFTFGEDEVPLNIYGDRENYKIFPDVGEQIRADGLVIAKRRITEGLESVQLSQKNLRRIFDGDQCKYVVGGATVIGVEVTQSTNKKPTLPQTMVEQPLKYHQAQVDIAREFKRAYNDIRQNYPAGIAPRIKPELHQALVRSEIPLMGSSRDSQRITLINSGAPVPEWSVKIIYSYTVMPTETHKMADTTGGKGVVGIVWPDARMPVDVDGNRADVIMDAGSIIDRSNPARLYEIDITASFMKTRKTIVDSLRDDPSPENKARLFEWLCGAYEILSPDFAAKVRKIGVKHLDRALRSPYFIITLRTDNPVELDKALLKLLALYPKCHDHLTYVDHRGITQTTMEKITIGVQYVIVLEKTGDEYSSVFSPVLQSQGIPGKLSKGDKQNTPGRPQATRSTGETEGRLYNMLGHWDALFRLLDLANSSESHKAVCEMVLTHVTPSDIHRIIDRQKYPRGNNRAVNIGNTTMFAAGFEFDYREVAD